MNLALLVVVLALGWAAATGSITVPSLMFGALVAAASLFVVRRFVTGPKLLPKLRSILSLTLLVVKELFLSAFRVARLVVSPDMEAHLRPMIVAFPLRASTDAEITLLANLITLTPGTLSIDVSEDRKILYIHAIDVADRTAFIQEIRDGFEKKVMEALR